MMVSGSLGGSSGVASALDMVGLPPERFPVPVGTWVVSFERACGDTVPARPRSRVRRSSMVHTVSMSLVEWTVLSGETIEAVAALLVNCEHPKSVRITPSVGDGGVDILDRNGDGPGRSVVYQVKRFNMTLTAGQKTNVKKSVDRLFTDPRWADLTIVSWRLVMPWDPTPEQEHWARCLVHAHKSEVDVVWHGQVFLDALAARYPDVIDYYLHGGRERQERLYKELVSLTGVENISASTDPASHVERIGRVVDALNHDPLYHFDFHTGHGTPAEHLHGLQHANSAPLLVMSQVQWVGADRWVQVDIVARMAVATELAPITMNGSFVLSEADPGAIQQLQDFHRFGAPIDHEDIAFAGTLNAPGGFGGPVQAAQIRLLPVHVTATGDDRLRMDVRTPSGELIAELDFYRADRSYGSDGVRAVITDDSGLLTIEIRADLKAQTTQYSLTLQPLGGQPVSTVGPIAQFVAGCHTPNTVRLGNRDAWPQSGVVDPLLGRLGDERPNERSGWDQRAEMMSDLCAIQARCAQVISTPDAAMLKISDLAQWSRIRELLAGAEVSVGYPDGDALFITVSAGTADAIIAAGSFTMVRPFAVDVGGTNYTLAGELHAYFHQAHLIDRRDDEKQTWLKLTTEGHAYRLHLAESEACHCVATPTDSDRTAR